MTDDALLDALGRLRDTGPEFDGFLSNHGPMAAEALTRLGASDAVEDWVSGYRVRLQDAPEVRRGIPADEWSAHLGEVSLVGDWIALLRAEAAERSWTDLLARWWPRLLPGLAAGATHGVIRTGHAVRSLRDAGDRPDPALVDELAQGLGYWAARYQPLPGSPALQGRYDAVTATTRLPRLDPSVEDAGPGIVGRLAVLDAVPDLPHALDRWGAPPDPDEALDRLIGAAARVLAAREDAPIAFCHAVTAPAAVRLVLPVLDPALRTASVGAAWQTVGGIVAAFAAPRRKDEDRPATTRTPVEDLVGRAVEHGDEHVIKLTEAALREHARSGDPTLLAAADRFRDRIPTG